MKSTKLLPLGKLTYPFLEKLLHTYSTAKDPRVVVGPRIGEDAAVIEFPDRYLVAKTDPVTFASEDIGWYAVNVNANDIATCGATPKWFMATILLPDGKTTKQDVERIFSQITAAANKLNISVVGGHTEITYNLDRPIVVGSMFGEVAKDKLVTTSGARPGDAIILTKGIVIEGTAIIAREKQKELKKKGYDEAFLERCKQYLFAPGLSVVTDALLANNYKIHAMHDPTEGGVSAGLYEIAHASDTGILVEKETIPILHESVILCREFGLNPLRTITSGTLLIVAPKNQSNTLCSHLNNHKIRAVVIGEVKEKSFGCKISENGKVKNLPYSATDDITKIFT